MESAYYNLSLATGTPNDPHSISHGPSQPPTCTLPSSNCSSVPNLSTSQSSIDDSAAWSYTPLSVQVIHQHDINYSTLENDAAYGEHSSALELGLNNIGPDLPSDVKDKVMENDIGRMYTESAILPRTSLASVTGYNPHSHVLVTESNIAHVNGHCHGYGNSSLVAHLGIAAKSEAMSNSQVSTKDRSLIPEPQYSSERSVAGRKIADWGYDLAGIGSQFSDLEQEEHEFCHCQ